MTGSPCRKRTPRSFHSSASDDLPNEGYRNRQISENTGETEL